MTKSTGKNRANGNAPQPVELRSGSVDETRALGEILGRLLAPGDVVLLQGALGAGKTAFAQGIACGLDVADAVNSPTFTILKEYEGRLPLYHFDLYRIDDPHELETLGFADYFDGAGVSVVEWAERGSVGARHASPEGEAASGVWPTRWLRIRFEQRSPSERVLRLTAVGARGQALLAAFAREAQASDVA
jgi:tRNA threonylcarbamoyladenosine biosynthesis protein TsaE